MDHSCHTEAPGCSTQGNGQGHAPCACQTVHPRRKQGKRRKQLRYGVSTLAAGPTVPPMHHSCKYGVLHDETFSHLPQFLLECRLRWPTPQPQLLAGCSWAAQRYRHVSNGRHTRTFEARPCLNLPGNWRRSVSLLAAARCRGSWEPSLGSGASTTLDDQTLCGPLAWVTLRMPIEG